MKFAFNIFIDYNNFMKNLIILLLLISCAKPIDPTDSNNPVYGSISANIGVDTPCSNCLILENLGTSVRVSFTENGIEECSGEGTGAYLSNDRLIFPSQDLEELEWVGNSIGDIGGKNPFCFPNQLVLEIKKLEENRFEISYSGKFFILRKIN